MQTVFLQAINTPINFFRNKFKSIFFTATVQKVTLIIILKVQKKKKLKKPNK